MQVTPLPIFGAKCKWKPIKRDKSTSRDFVARGRPLRGQTRLPPLAKRSTCSKSRNFFATHSYRLLWEWQCPEAWRHWHRQYSTTLAISREVACKGFVFPFFNRRSTTSWYCNEWTSFRFVNLKKCTISNYLQVLSICDVLNNYWIRFLWYPE